MLFRSLQVTSWLLLLLSNDCGAFSLNNPTTKTIGSSAASRNSALNVGYTLDSSSIDDYDEEQIMLGASACASSDSCSLEDMKRYMENVIHIQSDCASGALVGSAVCENQDVPAGIVANLREKIDRESKRISLLRTGAGVAGLSLSVILFAALGTGTVAVDPEVVPFTPQEWFWSIRDGYFGVMLQHYIRHGGLLSSAADTTASTPFTLQEWWWAINGGYFVTMMEQYIQNGGLSATAEAASSTLTTAAMSMPPTDDAVTPLTLQEWVWSMQGGYFGEMLEHNFRNGGLATDLDTEVLPLTPQEWIDAVKGGYGNVIAGHFFRNGGL